MKRIVLMSWSDSNMAGDDWTWFITLVIRKNRTYSVGAIQTATDGPTYKLPSIYPLRRGRQVREAIERLFSEDTLASEEIDWQKIIEVLLKHVPEVANEVQLSFAEEKIADHATDHQYKEQEKLIELINDWVGKAKWPLSPLSHQDRFTPTPPQLSTTMDCCTDRRQ